jgi:hypothetical protein
MCVLNNKRCICLEINIFFIYFILFYTESVKYISVIIIGDINFGETNFDRNIIIEMSEERLEVQY